MPAVVLPEVAPADRLATLPPWPWDPVDDRAPMTLGWGAARWAEEWLVQPNGPRAGQRFRCTPGQLVFLLWWYAMDDQGNWLFTHGSRRLAKGAGKSPFGGVQCLIEFAGPVRLARKDRREPGGCVGKPVDMPLVQIAAVAESQTQNTMRMVRSYAPKRSRVVAEYDMDPGKTRYYRLPEGTLEIITSSVLAAEGAEASFILADQTENWRPSNSGPELASVLEDNLAKSGSRMIETPNAWVPGVESVAESTWDGWLAQEEGRLRGETRVLYDARMAPADTDLGDYESLKAGLQWVYADCEWKFGADGLPDVRAQIERIWSPRAIVSESKRKYLNWPTVHEEAWTTPQAVAKLVDAGRLVDDDEEIVLFFDGSKSRDATALVACCVSDGHVFVPTWADGRPTIWEPDTAHDTEDVVPVADVDLAVAEVFGRYRNVGGFFADVQEWESFTKIEWPKLYADRLRVKAVSAGKDPQSIAWDMRGHVYDFTRAAELTLAEIADGGFTYDGNPILTRHLHNCRNRPNRWGVSVGKESKDSPRKIDAAVCLIGARMVRRLVLAAPPRKQRSGVVW